MIYGRAVAILVVLSATCCVAQSPSERFPVMRFGAVDVVRTSDGREIGLRRVELRPVVGRINLVSRELLTGDGEAKFELVQVVSDGRVLLENVTASSEGIRTRTRARSPKHAQAALWVWGTQTGLGIVAEFIDESLRANPEGAVDVARVAIADFDRDFAFEAVAVVKMGGSAVFILFDVTGAFGSVVVSENPRLLSKNVADAAVQVLVRQTAGTIKLVTLDNSSGSVAADGPGYESELTCCITCGGNGSCCCSGPAGCVKTDRNVDCGGSGSCMCTGSGCACTAE